MGISKNSICQQFLDTAKYFLSDSSKIILLLAGGLRYGAGYVWGQYSSLYFEITKNQTKQQIASYLGWIPAVGGVLGTIVGGLVADFAVTKFGIWARLGVVVGSNLLA